MSYPPRHGRAASRTTRAALASVLSDDPDASSVNHLVELATSMALAYLRQKARLGSLRTEYFGLELEDLAMDSTAELFARDETGRYVELRAYFDAVDWKTMSEEEVEMSLRRIVFGKVSEGLFRRFRENDPNLGKVIRNIKDVARTMPGIELERINRKQWLVFGEDECTAGRRPTAPPEFVEAHVASALCRNGNTVEAVEALARFLDVNGSYRNAFPLSEFARIIRSAFIRLGAAMPDEETSSGYSSDEIAKAIDAATTAVRTQFMSTYVKKKKVDPDTLGLYLRTVRDVLESQYVYDTSSSHSHFDFMASHEPGLSEGEYRRYHRNKFEYMVRTARSYLTEFLSDAPVRSAASA